MHQDDEDNVDGVIVNLKSMDKSTTPSLKRHFAKSEFQRKSPSQNKKKIILQGNIDNIRCHSADPPDKSNLEHSLLRKIADELEDIRGIATPVCGKEGIFFTNIMMIF